jgi:prophage maintenance system killer protein/predicted XRE-type DNA-binding protein
MNEITICQAENGSIEVRLEQETVWLSQEQIAVLFDVQKAAISKHLKNIFASGELEQQATVSKMETVQQEGDRMVTRQIDYFNLDAVISVGYRVNSTRATRFRQWATRLLREHLTHGYTLNRQRFEANARELEAALRLVKKAAQSPELLADTGRGLLEIVTRYAQTFLLLQRYDEGLLTEPPAQAGGSLPPLAEARASLADLKADLIARGDAGALFAQERGDAFEAILGNLDQSVFGEPAYPSVESKAAHLLYFVIKNHQFMDGNKRSGAFLFIDFLNRNNSLLDKNGNPIINDMGLAALALLVAESDPANKDTMIRLVMNMLVSEVTI